MTIELTKIQRESVEYEAGDLLVRGVPGSGKSVVLMKRALRFNKKAIDNKETKRIIIMSFTNSLVKYTKELVDLTEVEPCMIEIGTIDKICQNIFLKMSKIKFVALVKNSQERNEYVERAIQNHLEKTKKGHRFYSIEAEFWGEEFLWIKQKNIQSKEQYINTERSGRGGKVRMSVSDKAVAYELYEEYCKLLKEARVYDWEDLYIYIINNASEIPSEYKYDYVLVDEAQDLSYTKLKVAKLLSRDSITIAADKAQKIYNTSFSWKELGIDIRGRASKSLKKTFRSTKQIVQLAESLLAVNRAHQTDQSEYTEPVLPEREGSIPKVIICKNADSERSFVIKLIKRHLKANDVIGIFYRSYMECNLIIKWLGNARIDYEDITKGKNWSLNTPGVKLSTFHSAKGLEFDAVIIPLFIDTKFPYEFLLKDADEEQHEEILMQERSLLYVGMTRAKYDLYITYSGKVSMFLDDFKKEYYEHYTETGLYIPSNY